MRKLVIFTLAILFVVSFTSVANSAPVTLPSGAKGMKGTVFEGEEEWATAKLSVSVESDFISEIELEDLDGTVEGNINTVKLTYSLADRVDFYADLGTSRDIEYSANIGGSDLKAELTDEFAWGGGIAVLLYEWDNGLALNTDIKYRTVEDMDYDSVTVDGTSYAADELGGKVDADYEEWQIAFGVSRKFKYFTPYAGIKYADGEYSAKVIAGGTTYDLGSTGNDNNIGCFVGCSFLPTEQFAIDIEGRFIDEEAVNVNLTYMF